MIQGTECTKSNDYQLVIPQRITKPGPLQEILLRLRFNTEFLDFTLGKNHCYSIQLYTKKIEDELSRIGKTNKKEFSNKIRDLHKRKRISNLMK